MYQTLKETNPFQPGFLINFYGHPNNVFDIVLSMQIIKIFDVNIFDKERQKLKEGEGGGMEVMKEMGVMGDLLVLGEGWQGGQHKKYRKLLRVF